MFNYLLNLIRFRAKDYPNDLGQEIYLAAINAIGTDASPNDLAPDELGCAETVCDVIRSAGLSMPIILSTHELYIHLLSSTAWIRVGTPLAGDIIISPTGFGGKNGITHGHTGVILSNNKDGVQIASNSSATGTFEKNYTLETWRKRWVAQGGFPVYYFRRIIN